MTQEEALFDQKDVIPDERALKRSLGDVYSCYKEILSLTADCVTEWKFYGKKYGWHLKVMIKGRALLYLVPLQESFRVGCGVRDAEKEALLNSTLPESAKQELRTAKKYPEGYPVRFSIRRKSDMKSVRLVIALLRSMRM